MFNIKRTVYGLEVFLAGTGAPDRICTCDNLQKVERVIVWLSALNSLVPLNDVLAAKAALPTIKPS